MCFKPSHVAICQSAVPQGINTPATHLAGSRGNNPPTNFFSEYSGQMLLNAKTSIHATANTVFVKQQQTKLFQTVNHARYCGIRIQNQKESLVDI